MSVFINGYSFSVESESSFLAKITIQTSRYIPRKTSLNLWPKHPSFERNTLFKNTVLNTLDAQLEYGVDKTHPNYKLDRQSCPRLVKQINIHGLKARMAIQSLHENNQISDSLFKTIQGPINELEECYNYHPRIGSVISETQAFFLQIFVRSDIDFLKSILVPKNLTEVLELACVIQTSYVHPETSLPGILNLNPIIRDINQKEKESVILSIYKISLVLGGRACLEDKLSQRGPNIPDLEAQKRVITNLI